MAKSFQPSMNGKRLANLRVEFHMPKSVTLRAPRNDESPCDVQWDEVDVYMDAIYSGLRFPFQPFFRKVFHALGVAPI